MPFSLHAELFHDAPGWSVLRLAGRDYAMHLKRLEAVSQQGRRSLGRVSLAVILGMKHPAELVNAGGKPGMKSHVPDQSIFRPEVDGIGPRFIGHALSNELFGLLLRHRAFRHMRHHACIAGVGMDGRPVVGCEVANPQAFGCDGEDCHAPRSSYWPELVRNCWRCYPRS